MWKKRLLCAVLVLCAVLLAACQQEKEVFSTTLPDQQTVQQQAQELFTAGPTAVNFDDGSYDPTQEEGGDEEQLPVVFETPETTPAPTIQSEYAGATPVVIDPIDKPTPTPLPVLTLTYQTYEAPSLHMTFDAPAGWTVDDSQPGTFILTNPDKSMDYAANLIVRSSNVNKQYNLSDLKKEIKGMLDMIGSTQGIRKFEPSSIAERAFLGSDGVYARYTAVLSDGTQIAGKLTVSCVNKTLYSLVVSFPQGYKKTYEDGVYDKFRHTVKLK